MQVLKGASFEEGAKKRKGKGEISVCMDGEIRWEKWDSHHGKRSVVSAKTVNWSNWGIICTTFILDWDRNQKTMSKYLMTQVGDIARNQRRMDGWEQKSVNLLTFPRIIYIN